MLNGSWFRLRLFRVHPLSWVALIATSRAEAILLVVFGVVVIGLLAAIIVFLRKLKASHEQYRGIFHASTDGLIILSRTGAVVEANPAVAAMHGYSREEFSKLAPHTFIDPDSYHLFDEFVKAINQGLPFQCEAQDVRRDGSVFDVEVHGIPFQYQGEFHLLGIVRDISDRKGAERELKAVNEILEHGVRDRTQKLQQAAEELGRNERRTRRILDHAHDAFIAMDAQGRVLDWNLQAEQTFGWTREEALGQQVASLILPERFHAAHLEELETFKKTGASRLMDRRVEITGKHKSGAEFLLEMSASAVIIGETYQLSAFLHDISHRKEAERALKNSKNLYSSLVENLPIYVLRKDRQGRVTYGNSAYYELLGKPPEELLGKTDHDLFPKKLADKYRRDDERVMRTGQVFVDVEENLVGDKRWFFEVRKVPVTDRGGEVTGVQAIFWDVTERKLAQEKLQHTMEAAEAANEAKSEFLANMSHEMRTPLHAVIGLTDLLLDTRLDRIQNDYLSTIRDSGDALLHLINDILDVSKIEAGKLELEPGPFDLRELLGDTMKALTPKAHRKDLELALHIGSDIPSRLEGDAGRLRQVVMNLVGNAVKFTKQGEVLLDVARDGAAEQSSLETTGKTVLSEPTFSEANDPNTQAAPSRIALHFRVKDTGIGIEQQDLQRIFAAFEQVDASAARQYGGAGLGLAISAQLVELMGGRIWVESKIGQGSTFHFAVTFPTAVEESATDVSDPDRTEWAARLQGTPVLVVDDNATNRTILEEMLRVRQLQPVLAGSADQALRELRSAHQNGVPFPLVLTDVHMPEVDGFALIECIRMDEELRATPILVLTSGPRPDDGDRCQQLGVAGILSKPVKQSELLDAVLDALGLRQTPSADHSHQRRSLPPIASLRILLVEDSEVNQKLAAALLAKWGHQVTSAWNGEQAVEAVAQQPFDLVLMDVQMPIMDGLSATREIRRRENEGLLAVCTAAHHSAPRRLPIIAMTAHALKGDREKCLDAGMDEYVAKPIQQSTLYQAIAEVCVHSATTSSPTPNDENSPGDSNMSDSDSKCIDWSVALDVVGDAEDLLAIIAETAIDELPQRLQQLREAIAQADAESVKISAHTIVGILRTFHSAPAAALASSIEELGDQKNLDGAEALCDQLEPELDRVVRSLKKFLEDGEMT